MNSAIGIDGSKSRSTEAAPWLQSYPAGVNWSMPLRPAPISTLLDAAVLAHGPRICTSFLGKALTYAEIGRLISEAAAGLQALGVKKGTKVGLFLPNSPTFIVYYFAILKAGGTVVNYNPLYTLEELSFQVRDSETELMVTLDLKVLFDKVEALMAAGTLPRAIVCSFTALLPGAKAALFRLFRGKELARPHSSPQRSKVILEADLPSAAGEYVPVSVDPATDIAVIQYTGGTTGTPKGAMLSHANVEVNVQQVAAWAPFLGDGQERVLGVLPFFHVFAMTVVMNFAIRKGAEIVIMPKFVLNDALSLIQKHRLTVMAGVPTLFNAITNHADLKRYDLSSLKFCLSGGAPLPLDWKYGFEGATGCKLVEGYGLSEASPVVTCNPIDGPVKEGSIGIPLPGTTISLRSLSDPAAEVALGEKGEICIKGPQVMLGYWKRPAETETQFTPDGFLRTGDVARMDEDGFFFIEDRIKDLIISSGFNVYPRQIEDALTAHPAVEEAIVIGIKHPKRIEAPKAFVKLKAGTSVTSEELMTHLKPKLSHHEMPVAIEFRDTLPKTIIGKLSKKELKAEEALKQSGG